jgi:hypothetical protein
MDGQDSKGCAASYVNRCEDRRFQRITSLQTRFQFDCTCSTKEKHSAKVGCFSLPFLIRLNYMKFEDLLKRIVEVRANAKRGSLG